MSLSPCPSAVSSSKAALTAGNKTGCVPVAAATAEAKSRSLTMYFATPEGTVVLAEMIRSPRLSRMRLPAYPPPSRRNSSARSRPLRSASTAASPSARDGRRDDHLVARFGHLARTRAAEMNRVAARGEHRPRVRDITFLTTDHDRQTCRLRPLRRRRRPVRRQPARRRPWSPANRMPQVADPDRRRRSRR